MNSIPNANAKEDKRAKISGPLGREAQNMRSVRVVGVGGGSFIK
jgi:hypothetical protein